MTIETVTSVWFDRAEREESARGGARSGVAAGLAGPHSRPGAGERFDVAIVGAGVTGCACALALADRGLSVAVYDARTIAGGASGRSGGFALRGAAPAYDEAVVTLGREHARALWQLTERALDRMADIAGDALRRCGSLRLADAQEVAAVRGEHDALVEDGFAVDWIDDLDGVCGRLFEGAIRHPGDGSLDAVRWVRRLAARATDAGARIVEHAPVEVLADLPAERVVVATDGYTAGLLPVLDAAVAPARGQVVATAPLEERLFRCPHYARHGYDYWQQLEDGTLVLGGWRDAAFAEETTRLEAITPLIQERIEAFLATLVGRVPPITHRWAGIFGVTTSGLPLVGPVASDERVWVSAGYSGHGNVLGFACGELVGRALAGETVPELELFPQLS